MDDLDDEAYFDTEKVNFKDRQLASDKNYRKVGDGLYEARDGSGYTESVPELQQGYIVKRQGDFYLTADGKAFTVEAFEANEALLRAGNEEAIQITVVDDLTDYEDVLIERAGFTEYEKAKISATSGKEYRAIRAARAAARQAAIGEGIEQGNLQWLGEAAEVADDASDPTITFSSEAAVGRIAEDTFEVIPEDTVPVRQTATVVEESIYTEDGSRIYRTESGEWITEQEYRTLRQGSLRQYYKHNPPVEKFVDTDGNIYSTSDFQDVTVYRTFEADGSVSLRTSEGVELVGSHGLDDALLSDGVNVIDNPAQGGAAADASTDIASQQGATAEASTDAVSQQQKVSLSEARSNADNLRTESKWYRKDGRLLVRETPEGNYQTTSGQIISGEDVGALQRRFSIKVVEETAYDFPPFQPAPDLAADISDLQPSIQTTSPVPPPTYQTRADGLTELVEGSMSDSGRIEFTHTPGIIDDETGEFHKLVSFDEIDRNSFFDADKIDFQEGQLQTATNPDGQAAYRSIGDGVYEATDGSGYTETVVPLERGYIVQQQGDFYITADGKAIPRAELDALIQQGDPKALQFMVVDDLGPYQDVVADSTTGVKTLDDAVIDEMVVQHWDEVENSEHGYNIWNELPIEKNPERSVRFQDTPEVGYYLQGGGTDVYTPPPPPSQTNNLGFISQAHSAENVAADELLESNIVPDSSSDAVSHSVNPVSHSGGVDSSLSSLSEGLASEAQTLEDFEIGPDELLLPEDLLETQEVILDNTLTDTPTAAFEDSQARVVEDFEIGSDEILSSNTAQQGSVQSERPAVGEILNTAEQSSAQSEIPVQDADNRSRSFFGISQAQAVGSDELLPSNVDEQGVAQSEIPVQDTDKPARSFVGISQAQASEVGSDELLPSNVDEQGVAQSEIPAHAEKADRPARSFFGISHAQASEVGSDEILPSNATAEQNAAQSEIPAHAEKEDKPSGVFFGISHAQASEVGSDELLPSNVDEQQGTAQAELPAQESPQAELPAQELPPKETAAGETASAAPVAEAGQQAASGKVTIGVLDPNAVAVGAAAATAVPGDPDFEEFKKNAKQLGFMTAARGGSLATSALARSYFGIGAATAASLPAGYNQILENAEDTWSSSFLFSQAYADQAGDDDLMDSNINPPEDLGSTSPTAETIPEDVPVTPLDDISVDNVEESTAEHLSSILDSFKESGDGYGGNGDETQTQSAESKEATNGEEFINPVEEEASNAFMPPDAQIPLTPGDTDYLDHLDSSIYQNFINAFSSFENTELDAETSRKKLESPFDESPGSFQESGSETVGETGGAQDEDVGFDYADNEAIQNIEQKIQQELDNILRQVLTPDPESEENRRELNDLDPESQTPSSQGNTQQPGEQPQLPDESASNLDPSVPSDGFVNNGLQSLGLFLGGAAIGGAVIADGQGSSSSSSPQGPGGQGFTTSSNPLSPTGSPIAPQPFVGNTLPRDRRTTILPAQGPGAPDFTDPEIPPEIEEVLKYANKLAVVETVSMVLELFEAFGLMLVIGILKLAWAIAKGAFSALKAGGKAIMTRSLLPVIDLGYAGLHSIASGAVAVAALLGSGLKSIKSGIQNKVFKHAKGAERAKNIATCMAKVACAW